MKQLQRGLTAISLGAVTLAMASTFVPACGSSTVAFDGGGGCTGTQSQCGATCADLKKDHDNCGACGTACKAAELCSAGACATSCGGGTTQCGMTCVDSKNDPTNCGACGKTCGVGEVCSAGACGTTCGGNQTKCGGDGGAPYCASTQTDNANCGTCGKTCKLGEVCAAGTCASTCAQGQTKCGGDGGAPYCANTSADNANCGGCGVTCGQGLVCAMGVCSTNCGMNQTSCGGDGGPLYCANTQTDNTNCGGCGVTCGVLQACVGGTCQSACNNDGGAQSLCAGDGGPPFCANLQTDNANCGVCGKTCTNSESCQAGVCKSIGCNKTALVLADTDAASNTAYQTILQNAGFTVNVIASGSVNYAGNPAATGFGVVIVSPGTTYTTDMPAGGQTAIVTAQAGKTGVVFTEWAAYQVSNARYATLAPLILFPRAGGTTAALQFTLTAANHPLWTGLPNTFTTNVAMGANTGNTLQNGGVQIATCTQCTSLGVAARPSPNGRIVQLAHAAAYNGAAWYNDANVAKLTANAALWGAGCL